MTAVTGRKRRKRHNARRVASSTDDDSEHEPIKAEHLGAEEEEEVESPAGDAAPRAEGEEDEDEEEEEDEEEVVEGGAKEETEEAAVEVVPSRPCSNEEEEAGGRQPAMLLQEEEESQREAKGQPWRAPEDARSIVSGYSTLSTLGRSLGSEGRGEDADDEHSELVSETDNESGFASRSLTQERPDKQSKNTPTVSTQPPRSFLYTHYKPPVLSTTNLLAPPTALTHTPDSVDRTEGGARSTTPSSSSFSSTSTTHKLHSRPSFNSHKLIQCDTLARKKLKSEKAKARSLDLMELSGGVVQGDGAGSGSDAAASTRKESSKTNPSSGSSSQESPRLARPKPAVPPSEAPSFAPIGTGRSLAEQVRAHLLGSADDLCSVDLRKPLSLETRRKKRAWRRHTVVASPTEMLDKRPPLSVHEFPLSPISQNQVKPAGLPQDAGRLDQGLASRQGRTSRFHQYL